MFLYSHSIEENQQYPLDGLHSDADRARATQIRSASRLRQFIAGRLLAQRAIAEQVGEAKLRIADSGQPQLSVPGWSISIAHTDRYAVVALSPTAYVGIDIEQIKARKQLDALAEYTLAPSEFDRYQALQDLPRLQFFFACWSAKEAYLKALGTGINRKLTTLAISLQPAGIHDSELVTPVEGQLRILPSLFGGHCSALYSDNRAALQHRAIDLAGLYAHQQG